MQFRDEEYFRASLERMRQARTVVRDASSYALAMYLAGLAVESMLRAFRWAEDTSFEGRHDLMELLKASRLLTTNDEYMRGRGLSDLAIQESGVALRAKMNEIIGLWHNNLRFCSEQSLLAHLKRIGKAKGSKGDPLKKNAVDLTNAAQTVIDRGVELWVSRKRP